MRDYLYIWNDPNERLLVASGIEFRDLLPMFTRGGLVLLKHDFDDAEHDDDSGFDFVAAPRVSELASQNIYSWGDFRFADYPSDVFPRIPPEHVAELLYFAHAGRPLRRPLVESVGNRFLCSIHDDGWSFHAHYTNWQDIEHCLLLAGSMISRDLVASVKNAATGALWVREGRPEPEERTFDIDSILNRRAWKRRSRRRAP